jgi:hypothetical protein
MALSPYQNSHKRIESLVHAYQTFKLEHYKNEQYAIL